MTETAKHTPGPWKAWLQAHENTITEHQRDDGSFPIIAIVRGANKDAIAHLIAAAPTMLKALHFIADRDNLMFAECTVAEEIIATARAAIAEAEGR